MADPNQGQLIATVWEQKIGKKPADNIFTSRALFYALGEKGFKEESDGGRLIEFGVEFAENATHKPVGEFDALDTTRYDVFDCARYDWKITAGTVTVSDLERLRAQASAGKYDLIAEKLENNKDSHIAALNRAMWSDGSAANQIEGMQKVIASTPTTGTVGGINRATFSFWRNQQALGTLSSTPFDNVRSKFTSVYHSCSNGGVEETPTAVITTKTVLEGYESILTALQRYDRVPGKEKADVAFDTGALRFKGIPVFYDEDAPSGNAYFVNPKYLKFVYLQGGWMKLGDEIQPANQLLYIRKLATFGNMGTNASRRLGVVTVIT